MRIGLYAGTFDPITYGHLDIIKRGALLFDRLVVGISANRTKNPTFDLAKRGDMVAHECQKIAKETGAEIKTHAFDNLLIDCAHEVGASVIVRGLRAVADFEYEFQMVAMNRTLDAKIDTIFLMADMPYQAISSRLVKEIADFGGDISKFVTPSVYKAMREKNPALPKISE